MILAWSAAAYADTGDTGAPTGPTDTGTTATTDTGVPTDTGADTDVPVDTGGPTDTDTDTDVPVDTGPADTGDTGAALLDTGTVLTAASLAGEIGGVRCDHAGQLGWLPLGCAVALLLLRRSR